MWYLSKELAIACGIVTIISWAVALRYGAFTRTAQRLYQDSLANTNEVGQNAFFPISDVGFRMEPCKRSSKPQMMFYK